MLFGFPKIEFKNNKETFTNQEVKQIVSELNDMYIDILKSQISQFRFAKIVSYISLALAILLVAKEVFKI